MQKHLNEVVSLKRLTPNEKHQFTGTEGHHQAKVTRRRSRISFNIGWPRSEWHLAVDATHFSGNPSALIVGRLFSMNPKINGEA
jgi:hypothetical protein